MALEYAGTLDGPGARGIARDPGARRKQLEVEKPGGERIATLPGEAATKIADRIEAAAAEKLASIGAALTKAGGSAMEEVDEDAAASTRRPQG